MAVLAAEVEGREPAAVLDVGVGLGPAEVVHRLAEALPRRLVQGRVAVLKCDQDNVQLVSHGTRTSSGERERPNAKTVVSE